MLTLSQSHNLSAQLGPSWSSLDAGWAAVGRGSSWPRDKRTYGIRAFVRVTEVLHSLATGWHPHFHVILLLDRELQSHEMESLRASIAARFIRGVVSAGGGAGLEGQDLEPMILGTEGILAHYCFKGTAGCFTDGVSRNPLAILAHLWATGEGKPFWEEYTENVLRRNRMQRSPSRGIDSVLASGPAHYS